MSPSPEEKANVLYVDDLESNLVLFQATFDQDYNILLARSAAIALDVLKEKEIQVLVTDQRMPDMTGTELLEIVAREYPEIRRFLMTAFTDFDTVVEAVNKGRIHGYISKPLKAEEVRFSINNSLEIYSLRHRNLEMMKQLEEANLELRSLDGLKTEIIKVISQEIRNPLNRIMGTMHLLKDKVESRELSEVINILDNSVSRLEEFSSMTEQISILKSPGYQLKTSDISMKRILEYSLIEASPVMKEKKVEPDLRIEDENVLIRGESNLLVSCLVNLIRYAVDHCSPGGNVTITTRQEDHQVLCEILDQGKNYSDQLLQDLEKQFSADGSNLNLNLGLELGLAQMIMEAHGENIRFQQAGESRGSVTMVFARAREGDAVAEGEATGNPEGS